MSTVVERPFTYHLVLLAFAIVFAAIFTVMAFDWVKFDYPFGFLGLAVTFGLASRLP
jgi:hypothetical protein